MHADQRDITQVLWAQGMDVVSNSQQIGLIDFAGRARPAWHAFHFYAQMPTERVVGCMPAVTPSSMLKPYIWL